MTRKNKILSVAITAALSMGSGLANAADPATFELRGLAGTCGSSSVDAPVVASELFTSDTQVLPESSTFCVRYGLNLTSDIDESFYVDFELTNIGGFDIATPPALTLSDADSDPSIIPTAVASGDSTARFLVRAADITLTDADNNAYLDFKAAVNTVSGLKTPDQTVSLSVDLTYAGGDNSGAAVTDNPSLDVDLVKSDSVADIFITAASTPTARIEVKTGGKSFVGAISETLATLGTIEITEATTTKGLDLTTDHVFTDFSGKTADLTITNGPFQGSQDHTSDNVLVYIDLDGGGCDNKDVAATAPLTDNFTTATWEDMDNTNAGALNGAQICVEVPAATSNDAQVINQTDEAPLAALSIDFTSQNVNYSPSSLFHLKRNGAVCTVYVVPDGVSTNDKANVRIVNTTNSEGTLSGTLRDSNGDIVFEDKDLCSIPNLCTAVSGKIAPHQTVTVNSAALVTLAQEEGIEEWGQGTLTITSTLSELRLMNLLRRITANIGTNTPLMPMSVGATGSGCSN